MLIIGIDLAWGARKPDGVAVIRVRRDQAGLERIMSTDGDAALVACVAASLNLSGRADRAPALLAFDGPIICPNRTGSRPVDRLTHVRYGRYHAGCHPANRTICPRPARVAARFGRLGFDPDFVLPGPRCHRESDGRPVRRMIEVYPHPAAVRLFGLPRILKYKRGSARARRRALGRLQALIRDHLARFEPPVVPSEAVARLLGLDPCRLAGVAHKRHEDGLDAVLCALVGLHHWWHGGRQSEVLGDLRSGYIVVPAPFSLFPEWGRELGSGAQGPVMEENSRWPIESQRSAGKN
jgi:predicted RNase H-like nuclease